MKKGDIMKKIIVIYKSNYGSTSKYAHFIADELGCEAIKLNNISLEELKSYDTIIFGGGIYAFKINGLDFIKNNYNVLKNKNIIVWSTGLLEGKKDYLNSIWKHNLPEIVLDNIKVFYMRGGIDYNRLSIKDKMIIRLFGFKIKHSKNPSEDEKNLLQAIDKPVDFCSKKNVADLVAYVNENIEK